MVYVYAVVVNNNSRFACFTWFYVVETGMSVFFFVVVVVLLYGMLCCAQHAVCFFAVFFHAGDDDDDAFGDDTEWFYNMFLQYVLM